MKFHTFIKSAKWLMAFVVSMGVGSVCYGQYKLSWVANTYGDNANHVGNCAHSMWVDPNGIVYAASAWDENFRNIGVYSNGFTIGSIGGTSAAEGNCIAGDTTNIFLEMQGQNGNVGRFN